MPTLIKVNLLIFTALSLYSCGNITKKINTSNSHKKGEVLNDSYLGSIYNHSYSLTQKDNLFLIKFRPHIPKDGDITRSAYISKMIEIIYGGEIGINSTPELVTSNDKMALRYKGKDFYFYALPLKNTDGSIHGLAVWK